jgi:hypothetical protein
MVLAKKGSYFLSSLSSSESDELVSLFNTEILSHLAIFFLVFRNHIFLLVDNTKMSLELFLMTSSVDVPANLSSFCVIFFVQVPYS